MRLHYRDIILRERTREDVEDYIRWYTTETAWQNWDAPWEWEQLGTKRKVQEKRRELIRGLSAPKTSVRRRLEICHRDGTHIGMVNTYFLRGFRERRAVGIGIREASYWGQRLGTQAFCLWLAYLFRTSDSPSLWCETWSGNKRMMRLAISTGFLEVARQRNFRRIDGEHYDAITYRLERSEALERLKDAFAALEAADLHGGVAQDE